MPFNCPLLNLYLQLTSSSSQYPLTPLQALFPCYCPLIHLLDINWELYTLNGMLKSVREELCRTEIRITNLYLGGVDSAFWDNIDMRVNRDKMIQAKEAGRAIWFLCQQPSSGVVSEMVIQPFNHQAI